MIVKRTDPLRGNIHELGRFVWFKFPHRQISDSLAAEVRDRHDVPPETRRWLCQSGSRWAESLRSTAPETETGGAAGSSETAPVGETQTSACQRFRCITDTYTLNLI